MRSGTMGWSRWVFQERYWVRWGQVHGMGWVGGGGGGDKMPVKDR